MRSTRLSLMSSVELMALFRVLKIASVLFDKAQFVVEPKPCVCTKYLFKTANERNIHYFFTIEAVKLLFDILKTSSFWLSILDFITILI